MRQSRVNLRGAIVISSGRDPQNTNSPILTIAERKALIQKYWGDLGLTEPNASLAAKIKATKAVITPLNFDGKIIIAVENLGKANATAQFLRYDPLLIQTAAAQTTFHYFVMEEQHIFRRLSSDFDPDGIAFTKLQGKKTTHLGVRYGKSIDADGDAWFHVIVNAMNITGTVCTFLDDYDGAGGEPPGSGLSIPPRI